MESQEVIDEVDFVVEVQEEHSTQDIVPWPVIIFLLIGALVFSCVLMWASVNFHKADSGVKQWKIWSEQCEHITNINASRLHSDKEVAYFEGCPEGPGNEITINR